MYPWIGTYRCHGLSVRLVNLSHFPSEEQFWKTFSRLMMRRKEGVNLYCTKGRSSKLIAFADFNFCYCTGAVPVNFQRMKS
jgi:hypothetical protein